MEVDLECGIGFAFDAGLDVADFLPDLLLGIGIDVRQSQQGVEFVKVALAAVGFFNQHDLIFLYTKRQALGCLQCRRVFKQHYKAT